MAAMMATMMEQMKVDRTASSSVDWKAARMARK
jgi:hypothetical protein